MVITIDSDKAHQNYRIFAVESIRITLLPCAGENKGAAWARGRVTRRPGAAIGAGGAWAAGRRGPRARGRRRSAESGAAVGGQPFHSLALGAKAAVGDWRGASGKRRLPSKARAGGRTGAASCRRLHGARQWRVRAGLCALASPSERSKHGGRREC